MKVLINEVQKEVINRSLKQIAMLPSDLSAINDILKNVQNHSDIDITKTGLKLKDNGTKKVAELFEKEQYDDIDVRCLCMMLDLYIRICLGQWEEFRNLANTTHYFLDEAVSDALYDIRKKDPAFDKFKLYGRHASFGIHSKEISDDVRILYDFYKVLMFEKCEGYDSVYSFEPSAISTQPLPQVEFPMIKIDPSDIDNVIKNSNRKIIVEENEIFFPVKESHFQRYVKGDEIYLKRNGFYLLVSAHN